MPLRCSIARDVHLRWDEFGRLVAGTLSSPLGTPIPVDAVTLLDLFTEERDLDEAVAIFVARYADAAAEPDFESEVRRLAGTLLEAGLLVTAAPPQGGPSPYVRRDYSFASPRAHVLMLQDRVRTEAFRAAVERAAPGRTVLDLGCGSGILALFAARAGARHVYAIEETEIIDVAAELARANGLADRITFLRGNSRDLRLPEQVDVLVSEIIGTEPLGEGIVPVLRDAARRFLRPGGAVIPARLVVRAAGLHSAELEAEDADILASVREASELEAVYGLDMRPLAEAHHRELESGRRRSAFVKALRMEGGEPSDRLLTGELVVVDLELRRLDARAHEPGERPVVLRVVASGVLNAMATWFEAVLDTTSVLSTAPTLAATPASWGGQLVSALPPVAVRRGDTVTIAVSVDPTTTHGGIAYRLA